MRSRLYLFLFLAFTAFVASTSAQTNPGASTSKIAVINSYVFGDEKAGIAKYVAALKSVNSEFSTVETELKTSNSRLEQLAKEIQAGRDQVQKGVAVDQKTLQAKVEEAEKLQREMKFKQDDAQARFQRRREIVVGPIMRDIGNGLQEFARQKGFTLIFDVSKDNTGFLIAVGDEKADVTKDFIAYYNARPATAAAPKP